MQEGLWHIYETYSVALCGKSRTVLDLNFLNQSCNPQNAYRSWRDVTLRQPVQQCSVT